MRIGSTCEQDLGRVGILKALTISFGAIEQQEF